MKKYIVYAREGCPFCATLLEFMKERKEKFVYVLYYNTEDNLKKIMEQYNWRTVPIVLELEEGNDKGDRLIGGCDDTIQYLRSNDHREDPLPLGGDDRE